MSQLYPASIAGAVLSPRATGAPGARLYPWRALLAALIAYAVPSAADAQAVRVGSEFQVNTYTPGAQSLPAVASDAAGDFVVVWSSYNQDIGMCPFQPFCGPGVFGQRYSSSGAALGTEFQVNTQTLGSQTYPAVAADADGNFVVVWTDYNGLDVFGQRYDSGGTAVGSEFRVNTYTPSSQTHPAVASVSNGDFVVVWQSTQNGGGIFGQRYDSAGVPNGTEFQVNTGTQTLQRYPAVAADPNGDFVVVWFRQYNSYLTSSEVFGQRYDSGGNQLGTEFRVNTLTFSTQDFPKVAMAPDGDFVVVWQSAGPFSDYNVHAQRYASGGNPLGTEFQVNTYVTNTQGSPSVATDANGNFVVDWWSFMQNSPSSGIFAQRFARNGAALGTEFQVNTTPGSNSAFSANTVASAADGNFVAVWVGLDQDGAGVFGQRYAASSPGPCPPTPFGGCRAPGKSLLLIKDKNGDGAGQADRLIWKWTNGAATTQADFGNPTTTAEYSLCIYTGTAQALTLEATVPAGGTCGGPNCWKPIGTKGYKRTDVAASSAGISKILLKGGADGHAKVLVKGRDGQLDLTASTLPLSGAADVIVQLSNSDNPSCWQEAFPTSSVTRNTDTEFKAKTP